MSQLLPKATVKENRKKRAIRRRRQEIITSVKITRAMQTQIRDLARKMDRTQSWILREALQSWLTYHAASKSDFKNEEFAVQGYEVDLGEDSK